MSSPELSEHMPTPEHLYSEHKKFAEGVEASEARLKKLYKRNAAANVEDLEALKTEVESEDYPVGSNYFERNSRRNKRENEIKVELENFDKQNEGLAGTVEYGKYAVEKDADFYHTQAMQDAIAAGKKIVAPETGRLDVAKNVKVLPDESKEK